jgi:hypothetical protein
MYFKLKIVPYATASTTLCGYDLRHKKQSEKIMPLKGLVAATGALIAVAAVSGALDGRTRSGHLSFEKPLSAALPNRTPDPRQPSVRHAAG